MIQFDFFDNIIYYKKREFDRLKNIEQYYDMTF